MFPYLEVTTNTTITLDKQQNYAYSYKKIGYRGSGTEDFSFRFDATSGPYMQCMMQSQIFGYNDYRGNNTKKQRVCGTDDNPKWNGIGITHFEAWVVPKPVAPSIMTEAERAWLGEKLNGANLTDPYICYDKAKDPWDDRRAQHFHKSCGGKLKKGEMLVTVAWLSTGRKVVGKTITGFTPDRANTASRYIEDNQAAMFEVTSRTVYPVYKAEANTLYYRPDYGPTYGSGHDFHMNKRLDSGYCNTGHMYGWKGMDRWDMCGNNGGWGVEMFEAWIVMDPGMVGRCRLTPC
jgi:hypothetical protein